MLLRFKVENFKSLYREQEFSMVPAKGKDRLAALPVALIYGANASGKSSFVQALEFMFKAVRRSVAHSPSNSATIIPKFMLGGRGEQTSSKFEVDFEIKGVRYNYGFISDTDLITEEWLFAFPSKRPVRYFERKSGSPIRFGDQLKGRNRDIEKLTRPSGLFLPIAGALEHEQLEPIWAFFVQSMFVGEFAGTANSLASRFGQYERLDPRVIIFLRDMSTGITSHRFQKHLRAKAPSRGRNAFTDAMGRMERSDPDYNPMEEVQRLELGHTDELGEIVYFPSALESSGTIRLLALLERVFLALDVGMLLVIDEIDLSLHTRACEAIIELFNNPEINRNGAQLIATTHDTNLIASEQLGRDQIWFAEKDAHGATEIYSLSDFKVRKSYDFEQGYLRGRFGALPFAGDPAMLFRSMRATDDEKV